MGKVAKVVKKVAGPIAAIASVVPGPHQPLARAAYTGISIATSLGSRTATVPGSSQYSDSDELIRESEQRLLKQQHETLVNTEQTKFGTGLVNYLNSLQSIAPTYVARGQSKLTSGYKRYYDKIQSQIQEAKQYAKTTQFEERRNDGEESNNNGAEQRITRIPNSGSTYSGP
jgi:hypothetical protein